MGLQQSSPQLSPQGYTLRYPRLLSAPLNELLHPELIAALQAPDLASAVRHLARHEFEDVYSLPVLTVSACEQFRSEAEAFREWRRFTDQASPGLLLSGRWYLKHAHELYDNLFDVFLANVLCPVDVALYGRNAPLVYHHDYCICFEEGGDQSLKPHTDDSDVTFNIFLGNESGSQHRGAELLLLAPADKDIACGTPRLHAEYAGKMYEYTHTEVGRMVCHPGDRWHAVKKLDSGSRWNLLTWALRNDAKWKATFFTEMDRHLSQKAKLTE